MSAQLVPLSGGGIPTIPLQRPVLLIGRHGDCDVRIDLPKISRRHCCVALAYDRVMIRDLGSRNGLRVNGRIVEESPLYPGDEVAIGPLLYRVDIEGQPNNTTPPAPAASVSPESDSIPDLPIDPNPLEHDLIPLD